MDVKGLAVVMAALLFFFITPTPIIQSVTPNTASNTSKIEVTIQGDKFAKDAAVKLSRSEETDVVAKNVTILSPQKINCTFDLKDKSLGKWDLVVTNKKIRSAKLVAGFTVGLPSPTVKAVTPDQSDNNGIVALTIKGSAFRTGAFVVLSSRQMDIGATKVKVASEAQINCVVNVNQADPGVYNVKVINDDGKSGVLIDGFTITGPAPQPAVDVTKPTIAKITPNRGFNNGMILTCIEGKGFESSSIVKLSRNGQDDLPGLNIKVEDNHQITCFFDISSQPEGKYNVEVTNPSGQKAFLADGFTVESFTPVLDNLNKKLKAIYFDTDKFEIRSNQVSNLNADLVILKTYPKYFIILGGHTDERGGINYNLELSEKRANAVKGFLAAQGIDPQKITIYAYGKEFPSATGHDESSWWQNRRVDIKIWEAPTLNEEN
jgi:outer membrane protein OmpA-like peptidoglycan-associated protein